jgi:hypothetical protein
MWNHYNEAVKLASVQEDAKPKTFWDMKNYSQTVIAIFVTIFLGISVVYFSQFPSKPPNVSNVKLEDNLLQKSK